MMSKEEQEEKVTNLMAQGLVAIDIFSETGNRFPLIAWEDQAEAFVEEAYGMDLEEYLKEQGKQ